MLMAMVDSKYTFVWGSCGFPGNSHDAIIFKSTKPVGHTSKWIVAKYG